MSFVTARSEEGIAVSANEVRLTLSQDEGLVLLEWLSNLDGLLEVPQPELWVLWKLENSLERQIDVVVSSRYAEELESARTKLCNLNGLEADPS